MTSAIGDILTNPNIKKKEDDRPGLIERLLNSTLKGAAWLPDTAINTIPQGANYWGDALLNRFTGPDNQDPLEKAYQGNVDSGYAPQHDPIESSLKAIGAVKDLPAASTAPEQITDALGGGLGSLILPGAAGAKVLTPAAFGSVVAPAFSQPAIQSIAPDSPKTQMALNLAASLLGGYAGAKGSAAMLPKEAESIPDRTAAQQSAIDNGLEDPKTMDLVAKQLDIAKKDPKAADALMGIANQQQSRILSNLTPQNPISGGDVVDQIKQTIGQLKAQKNTEYQGSLKTLLDNAPAEGVNTSATIDYLKNEFDKAADGSSLKDAIGKALNLVTNNAGDPQKLISAKTSIQGLGKPNGVMTLGSKESAILNNAAKQLNSDIDSAIPGYSDMNAKYAQQMNQISSLINGTIGNAAKTGINKPSNVIQNLFEKTDPELAGQLREALPDGVYNQAADMYLGNVADRGLSTPTKNAFNNISQYQKIAAILQKNRETLGHTLPETQNTTVDQTLQGINESALGLPRNDYGIGARRNVSVGGEIRGLGDLLKDGAMWLPRKAGLDYLNRQEMLTGVSPTQQMVQGAQNAAPAVAQSGVVANAITDGQIQPAQPNNQMSPQPIMAPQMSQQPMYAPPMSSNTQTLPSQQTHSPLDAVMGKYGIGGRQVVQQPNAQQPSQPSTMPQAPSQQPIQPAPMGPLDSVMGKYGIGGQPSQAPQQAPQPPRANQPPKSAPMSPAEMDYLTQQIQSGNNDAIYDFDNSYKNSRKTAQTSGNTSNNSDLMMQIKDSVTRAFPDNPTMQKVAIAQAILESGLNGSHPSALATQNHNLYGIKEGHTAPGTAAPASYNTTEYSGNSPSTQSAKFSSNNTYDDSINQYKNLMTQAPRYSNVISADTPEQAFVELQKAGYATDPQYANKLISIYNKNVAPLFSEM